MGAESAPPEDPDRAGETSKSGLKLTADAHKGPSKVT